jgi:hypothetical protein
MEGYCQGMLVVVQSESQLTLDIEKDSSLPLGMTLRGIVIPNPSTNTLRINSVRDLGQTEPLAECLTIVTHDPLAVDAHY